MEAYVAIKSAKKQKSITGQTKRSKISSSDLLLIIETITLNKMAMMQETTKHV